jgi:SP family sugar:H+ symporter-like MFS transporter
MSTATATPPAGAAQDRVNMGFVAAIVAVATIGGFMFGYDSGVINGTQDGLKQAFHLDDVGVGLNVAAILVGCAVGAFLAGWMADLIGRRTVMIIAALFFIASAIAAGASDTSMMFMIARFIGGMGVGAASVLAPAYISEVTPARIRGRLSSVQQVMIITGLTGAFLVNYLLAQYAGVSTAKLWGGYEAWRWMFWAQVIPAAIFFLTLLGIPESPRYLVAKRHDDKAQAVLGKLFGTDAAPRKVEEIRASLAGDHRPQLSDLVDKEKGRIRPIVWVGIGLAVFQQLVGINIVFYYGSVLWQSVGFSEHDALQVNVMSGGLSILACIVAIAVIDFIGRKPMLLIGSFGMAITLGIMAWAFYTGNMAGGTLHLSPQVGRIALYAANAYVVLFNFSWGPVMWVMLGEMFPNRMRGSGLAVAGFAQWIANFGISFSVPWLSANLGLMPTYAFYAVSAAVSFVFVLKAVHETRGRELEHMTG